VRRLDFIFCKLLAALPSAKQKPGLVHSVLTHMACSLIVTLSCTFPLPELLQHYPDRFSGTSLSLLPYRVKSFPAELAWPLLSCVYSFYFPHFSLFCLSFFFVLTCSPAPLLISRSSSKLTTTTATVPKSHRKELYVRKC